MESLQEYYIKGDTLVLAKPHMDRSDWDWSIKCTTSHGAKEFLRMLQNARASGQITKY